MRAPQTLGSALANRVRSYNLGMSIPTRSDEAGTYFVTSGTFNRRRLFRLRPTPTCFLRRCKSTSMGATTSYTHLSSCRITFHLLLSPRGLALERVMGFIKGGFSHRLSSKLPVWQRGFTDHRVRDGDEFQMRRQYIHHNPVRAKLVELPGLYPYSSAYRPEEGKAYLSG
jgi:putative transposase